jgi:hypothetical protein
MESWAEDEEPMALTDWGPYAQNDPTYMQWLERVDRLCDRLMDIQFEALVLSQEIDPSDDFFGGTSPELFVQTCIVPMLEQEHGAEFIYDLIGEQLMWGDVPPREVRGDGP